MRKPFFLIVLFFIFCSQKENQNTGPIVPLPEYTEDNPREWSEIAEEHIPQLQKVFSGRRNQLYVEVPLKQSNYEHYIEKIGLLSLDGKEIAVQSLERKHRPQNFAYFDEDLVSGMRRIKVFAKCNLHDLWTKVYKVP